jgi:hypothetical protein
MAGQLHRDTPRNTGSLKIPDSGATEVMPDLIRNTRRLACRGPRASKIPNPPSVPMEHPLANHPSFLLDLSRHRALVEASRRVFAHLLRQHPTADALAAWLRRPELIDERVIGTAYAP